MQTQCPHCQTRFHVTDEQLQVADGQVRCGQCDEVFTAEIIAAPVLNEINEPELCIDELSIDTLDEIHLDVIKIEVPELESSKVEEDKASIPALSPLIESEAEAEKENLSDEHNQPSLRLINADKPIEDDDVHQAELDPIQISKLLIDTSLKAANSEHELDEPQTADNDNAASKETTNLPDEGYTASELYPELDTVPVAPQSTPLGYVLVGSLLILLFMAQSIYLLRDNLASHGFRPLMQTLCAKLNCDLALPRSPNDIILKSREIRSHPNIKNALSVKATITNKAGFRQAFPLLQIQFHDIEGRIIAGRDFLPNEYLPDDVNVKTGIAPNNPVNIALELIDPGKNAVSFLFIFK